MKTKNTKSGKGQLPVVNPTKGGKVNVPIVRDHLMDEIGVEYGSDPMIYGNFSRCVTIEDLIARAQIDLQRWKIVLAKLNKWDGLQKGGRNRTPLFQITLSLRPRTAEDRIRHAIVRAARQKTFKVVTRPWAKHPGKRILTAGNAHIGFALDKQGDLQPYQDRAALDALVQMAGSGHFNEIVLIGGMIEPPAKGDALLSQRELVCLEAALIELRHWLAMLTIASGKKAARKFLLSPSEAKAWEALGSQIPDLQSAGKHPLEVLLGLKTLGWELVLTSENKPYFAADDVLFTPGPSAASQSRATEMVHTIDSGLVVYGSAHRNNAASRQTPHRHGNMEAYAVSIGCACALDRPVPSRKRGQFWEQGFGVVEFIDGARNATFTHVPVNGGTAVYNGRVYRGQGAAKDVVAILPKLQVVEL